MLSVEYTCYLVTAMDHMPINILYNGYHNNIMYSSVFSIFVQYSIKYNVHYLNNIIIS